MTVSYILFGFLAEVKILNVLDVAIIITMPNKFYELSIDDQGNAYSGEDGMLCQDAQPLPDHPTTCSIDGSTTLDVKMRDISRTSIPTYDHAIFSTKKSVGVTCAGDSALDTITTFKYTELDTVPGAVSSSTKGLGIAMKLNGTSISSSNGIHTTFSPGNNTFELEFALVRPSDIPASHIATGVFQCDVVMIISELRWIYS